MRNANNNSTTDLQLVTAFILLSALTILLPPLNETPLRVILGLPLVLFLPGYSLTAALFPRKDDLGFIERIALSFGLSIAIAPFICLILNYTPWGIRLIPILISVSEFTILSTALAYKRRMNVENDKRFTLSFNYKLDIPTRTDKILTSILLISIIISLCTVIYALTTPRKEEKFTEFYILGPGGKAGDYPTNLSRGETGTVIIEIINREYEPMNYKLKVEFNNETLLQREINLHHNETFRENFTFTPIEKSKQRMEFLLYKENITEPYRSLHLWIQAY